MKKVNSAWAYDIVSRPVEGQVIVVSDKTIEKILDTSDWHTKESRDRQLEAFKLTKSAVVNADPWVEVYDGDLLVRIGDTVEVHTDESLSKKYFFKYGWSGNKDIDEVFYQAQLNLNRHPNRHGEVIISKFGMPRYDDEDRYAYVVHTYEKEPYENPNKQEDEILPEETSNNIGSSIQ